MGLKRILHMSHYLLRLNNPIQWGSDKPRSPVVPFAGLATPAVARTARPRANRIATCATSGRGCPRWRCSTPAPGRARPPPPSDAARFERSDSEGLSFAGGEHPRPGFCRVKPRAPWEVEKVAGLVVVFSTAGRVVFWR